MGIFLMPFALLLKFFYDFFQSYGIALILFALIIKLVLFPFSLKGKRSMIQMNLLSGKMQQLQKQYGKDRERYNLEVQKLYEKEKVNPMSGCLWSFIPILFLMVLYGIIREPLTYFMGLTMEQIQLIAQELDWQTVAVSSGWVTPAAMEKLVQQVADGKLTSVFQNGAYNQMYLASMINPDNLAALQALLATGRRGQMLAQGITCALIGRPNAGKSSLLNALAGYERAIVTDIPGTTRDTVEESVLCGGVLLRLIDTAGIRATEDPVEQLGVERSRRAIASAELVLAVVDGAEPEDPEEGSLLADVARCGVPWLLVFTKRDMAGGLRTAGAVFPAGEGPLAPPAAVVSLSSVTGEGLEDLGNAVAALFPAGDPGEAGSLLTDRRQEDAARRALDAVRRALEALETGMTPDAVLTDAEEALDALGELTGRTAKEEIVSRIFSRFCVGK